MSYRRYIICVLIKFKKPSKKLGGFFYMQKIGIDPDVDKNGVAIKNGDDISLYNLTFFELFDKLKDLDKKNVRVYIECGFLNKSNWHKVGKGSAALNAKIGNNTGRNHEVARKIVEMCKYLNLDYKEVKPTSRKIDAKQLKALTGISKRTNQEQRDALMLILGK